MGYKKIHICDICDKQFDEPRHDAYKIVKVTFQGQRHTDAAGQGGQFNSFQWEAHEGCWKRYAARLPAVVEEQATEGNH